MRNLKHKKLYLIIIMIVITFTTMFLSISLIKKNQDMSRKVSSLVNYEEKVKTEKISDINKTKNKISNKIFKGKKVQHIADNVKKEQEKIKKANEKKAKELAKKEKEEAEKLAKKQKEQEQKNQNQSSDSKQDNSNSTVQNVEPDNSDIGTLLSNGGLKPVQVNAVIANLQRESTLNPNADNGAGNQGLAQWGGSRLANLKNTCGGLGTTSCQINFLLSEMKSGINGFSLQEFNTYTDVNSANAYFKSRFEGAA